MQLSSSVPSPTSTHEHPKNQRKKSRGNLKPKKLVGEGSQGEMGSEGSTSPAAGGGAACAVCGSAAVVYCAADAATLCVPCDAAVHAANPLASRHERVPLAAAAASGVYDDLFAADDVDAASSWPGLPPAPGQGSPQGSSSTSFTTSDSGADGRSLFDLLSDVDLAACVTGGHLPDGGGVAPVHHASAPFRAAPPPGSLAAWAMAAWSSADAANVVVPATATAAAFPGAAEREARVQRYREKRKNRKFQKTIRYASRKAYAEARPRIKGRFVKRAPGAAASSSDSDAAAAAADSGDAAKFWLSFSDDARDDVGFYGDAATYGVVPSF